MNRMSVICATLVCSLAGGARGADRVTVPADKAEEAARLVAAMLVAGRGVVSAHQKLINDAAKGDKGFTADFVEPLMLKDFEKATGISLTAISSPAVKAAVAATVDAAKKAVANNQGRINEKGKAFKGFIPGVFGRVTGNILKGESGIELKQTTFNYRKVLYGKPDEFEAKVLKTFAEAKPKAGYGERAGNRYRYLLPVYIQESCLQCHGDPKGEIDVSGKVKEGYKLGELRGAISVSILLQ